MAHPMSERMADPRLEFVVRISHLRWGAAAMSLVLVALTHDPAPLSIPVAVGVSLALALYNIPMAMPGRVPVRLRRWLPAASVTADFLVCVAWLVLTSNDAHVVNFVMVMLVGTEAAMLFRWPGTIAFLAAVLPTFVAISLLRQAAFHYPFSAGSMVFRSGMVTIMALFSGSLSQSSEERRMRADLAAGEAWREALRLEVLHRVTQRVIGSLQSGTVVESAIATLGELFPERWHGILLNEEGILRLVQSHGLPDHLELRIPDTVGLPGALVFHDIWTDTYLEMLGVTRPESIRGYNSALAVALKFDPRMHGVLLSMDRQRHAFNADDTLLFEALAPQLSTALENARLFEEVQLLALTDPLTSLANRRSFDARLAEEVTRAARYGLALSLVLLDVDHFKAYNDRHGHPAGDDVLRRLGLLLREEILRTTDLAFRYGGEEFAILMPGTSARQAEMVMSRLHDALQDRPLPHGEHQPSGKLTFSAGVASSEGTATETAAMLANADLALFAAKEAGRGQTIIYQADLADSLTNWTSVLPTVMEARSLEAVYQPIVRLSDGAVIAYEALARPAGAAAGSSVEGMFAAAQRMGLLMDLDWLCYRAAIQCASSLDPTTDLFVNITFSALMDASRDPDWLELVLRWARMPVERVVLEISEREAVTDSARFKRMVANYRQSGFRFALDDIGEGHSTLEVLAAAEPEFIKVARSMVLDARGPGSRGAIEGLVGYAHSTGAVVIAEGIEDAATANLMAELGVTLGQGYLLGRPMAVEAGPRIATG